MSLQESAAATKIKDAFFSDRGLSGSIEKLPLEKVFELDSVKKVWTEARHVSSRRSCSTISMTPDYMNMANGHVC